MKHELITTDEELVDRCGQWAQAQTIAFDTEFVSEHTYRPQLCLIQVAADDRLAVIDPLGMKDVSPFWKLIVDFPREIIVHAGREEMAFCLDACGRQPQQLFDIQIAAGLIGLEYPAGYGSLLVKLLGKAPSKGETRTDWRVRPLTARQIDYAVEDVLHLKPMRDKLHARLTELNRTAWLRSEIADWQAAVELSLGGERWRKVSGSSTMNARGLAIVRELWRWRDGEARRRNWPHRRVLRDDLIVELAKRRTADPKQIPAVRGFERGDLRRAVPELAESIERALAMPESELPRQARRDANHQVNMVAQFLSSALNSICRAAEIAPSIVGTAEDVRELVAHRLNGQAPTAEPPALTLGWRAEIVGQVLNDLLDGKLSIRIRDPRSEQPLTFEPTEQG